MLLCLILTGILTAFHLAGISPVPGPSGDRKARELLTNPRTVTVTGTVSESEVRDDYSVCTLEDPVLAHKADKFAISSVKITFYRAQSYPVGSILTAVGEAELISPPDNPGQFDSLLYSRLRGIRYSMKDPAITVLSSDNHHPGEYLARLRRRIKSFILSVFPEDVSGIMCALLIGDRSYLDNAERSEWQVSGLIHMLAISGLHLALLGRGLAFILRTLRIGRKHSAIISMFFMIFFTVLAGMPVSAVRALIMFLLMTGAELAGRTYDPPTALAISAILILFENPWYLCYPGFQLSFTAVFITYLFRERGKLTQAVELHLFMLPLVLWHYCEMPLYGVLVNLLVLPFVPLILVLGIGGCAAEAAVSAFTSAMPSYRFTYPATLCVRLLRVLMHFVQKLPFATIICGRPSVPCLMIYCILLILWSLGVWKLRYYYRRFLLYLLIPPMIFILTFHPRSGLRILTQSVGQGDSILIETKDGKNFLIDGGSSSVYEPGYNRILPCLKYEGVRVLDYLFLTHMDDDHICGIREILRMILRNETSLRVRTVVMPYLRDKSGAWSEMKALAEEAGARVLCVSSGDHFLPGDVSIDVLGPDPSNERRPPDANAQSMLLALSYGDFDALFTGDVSGAGEAHLIREVRAKGLQFEFLKVAHHGSKYSTPDEFLNLVQPEISVISCGLHNRYGHPGEQLLNRLEKCGTHIFRTDRDGAVTVTTDGKRYRVRTFHGT